MTSRVYVGRLNYRVHGRDLNDLFSSCGYVKEMFIKYGYAFVEYENPRAAERAVERLHDTLFMGERIIVELAKSRRNYRPYRAFESPSRRARSPLSGHSHGDEGSYRYWRPRARSPLPYMSHRRRRSFSRSPMRVSRRERSRSPRRDHSASDGSLSRDGRSLRSPPRRDSRERSRSSHRGQKSPSREHSSSKSPFLYTRSVTPEEENLPLAPRTPDGSPHQDRSDDQDKNAHPGSYEDQNQVQVRSDERKTAAYSDYDDDYNTLSIVDPDDPDDL